MSVFAWYYSRDVLLFFFPSSNADTCFQETAKRIEAVFHTQCDDYHNALTEVVRKQRWQREKAESDTRRRLMYLIWAHELALLSSRSIIWLLTQLELHLPLHESLHCAVMSHTHTHPECEGRSAESGSVATDSHGSTDHLGGISLHPSNITQGFTDSLKSSLLSVCLICSPLLSKTPNKCFLRHYSAGCQIDSLHTRGHCWFSKSLTAKHPGKSIILQCPLE